MDILSLVYIRFGFCYEDGLRGENWYGAIRVLYRMIKSRTSGLQVLCTCTYGYGAAILAEEQKGVAEMELEAMCISLPRARYLRQGR